MTRNIFALLIAAGLCTWASGQGVAPGLSAAEQLRMLGRNLRLLDDMVDRGLTLADAQTPLSRLEECRQTAVRLSQEMKSAVAQGDADRVNEIGEHLNSVVRHGMVPNLRTARQQIPPGSQDYERLRKVHAEAARNLGEVQSIFPTTGDWSKRRRVQETRDQLAALSSDVGAPGAK